jgi:hypothetical protein
MAGRRAAPCAAIRSRAPGAGLRILCRIL